MVRYETLILASPEITSEETKTLEAQFVKIANQYGVTLTAFDCWGKLLLAYPVRKYEYGVYFLGRFEVSPEKAKKLLAEYDQFFTLQLPTVVMRFLHTRLEADTPIDYVRPDSLEETPGEHVDTLFREHRLNRDEEKNDIEMPEKLYAQEV